MKPIAYDYDLQDEVNRLIKCFGCWSTEPGTCRVKYEECQSGTHDCEACPAYSAFYTVMKAYTEQEEISITEALWLTCQFYDIKTAYMCDGEIAEWSKTYTPEKYRTALKRQKELMGEPDPESEDQ